MKDITLHRNTVFAIGTRNTYSGDKIYKDVQIHCPVCDFEYNHLNEPVYERGYDNWETSAPEFRGDLIRIPFYCENGHEWQLCFGFHKGNIFSFIRIDEETL